jgi:hypothetical protein
MGGMGPPSRDEPDPTGYEPDGRGLHSALVALVQDTRGDGPMAVRYIQCDICAGPTPHHAEVQIFSTTSGHPAFIAAPPEVVCGVCCSVHPRVVGDEPPRDTEVSCAARRLPRLPLARLRLPLNSPPLNSPRLDLSRLAWLRDRARSDLSRIGRLPLARILTDRAWTARWPVACAHRFVVPAMAPAVICPRCATAQPGPAFPVSLS